MYLPSDHSVLVEFAKSVNHQFDINIRDFEYLVILACEYNRQDILDYICKSKSIPFNESRLKSLVDLQKNTKEKSKKKSMEYGILIKTADKFKYYLNVIKEHNEQIPFNDEFYYNRDKAGGEITIKGLKNYISKSKAKNPKYPSGLYLVINNTKGMGETISFLFQRMESRDVIITPPVLPKNWFDFKDYLSENIDNIYDKPELIKDYLSLLG